MRFHLPSFLMGVGLGYAGKALSSHLRPVLLELATAGYELLGVLQARAGRAREDLGDVMVEARLRADARRAEAEATAGRGRPS